MPLYEWVDEENDVRVQFTLTSIQAETYNQSIDAAKKTPSSMSAEILKTYNRVYDIAMALIRLQVGRSDMRALPARRLKLVR